MSSPFSPRGFRFYNGSANFRRCRGQPRSTWRFIENDPAGAVAAVTAVIRVGTSLFEAGFHARGLLDDIKRSQQVLRRVDAEVQAARLGADAEVHWAARLGSADAQVQAARLGADAEVQAAWLRADAAIQAGRLRADAEIQAAQLRADAANQAAREAKELLDFIVNGRRHHCTVVKEVDATKRK